MLALFNLLFMFFCIFCLFVVKGIVILCGWDWFVTPFDVPMLTLAHGIGLGIFIGFLTNMDFKNDEENTYKLEDPEFIPKFSNRTLQVIGVHLFVLLFMYIAAIFTPTVL